MDWTLLQARAWTKWRDDVSVELAGKSPDEYFARDERWRRCNLLYGAPIVGPDIESIGSQPRAAGMSIETSPRSPSGGYRFAEEAASFQKPKPIASDNALLAALRSGQAVARGRHDDGIRQNIPSDEWLSGWNPPRWTEVFVGAAEVQALFPYHVGTPPEGVTNSPRVYVTKAPPPITPIRGTRAYAVRPPDTEAPTQSAKSELISCAGAVANAADGKAVRRRIEVGFWRGTIELRHHRGEAPIDRAKVVSLLQGVGPQLPPFGDDDASLRKDPAWVAERVRDYAERPPSTNEMWGVMKAWLVDEASLLRSPSGAEPAASDRAPDHLGEQFPEALTIGELAQHATAQRDVDQEAPLTRLPAGNPGKGKWDDAIVAEITGWDRTKPLNLTDVCRLVAATSPAFLRNRNPNTLSADDTKSIRRRITELSKRGDIDIGSSADAP